MMSIGRNEPCPCGSGKKFKRCCLAAEAQSKRPPGQDLHDLDQRLFTAIWDWASRRFPAAMKSTLDDYPIDIEDQSVHLPLFSAWLVYERKVEGQSLASWYLEERGRNLMAHERDWLNAQHQSCLSVWEVLEVERGKSIRMRDLFTGAERTVSEVSGSADLSPHLLLLVRVVDHAGLSLLIGSHPSPLLPEVGKETLNQIRSELGLGKQATPQELREADRPTDIIELWEEAVQDFQNRPLPQLKNTDGEDLVFVKDHYALVGTGARAKVEAGLGKERDVEPPVPGERPPCYRVVQNEKGNAVANTLVATLTLKARGMVVETNSRQRADRLRVRFEDQFGECLRFKNREEQDVEEAMAQHQSQSRPSRTQPEGPEVDAMLLDFKKQHYATWPDASLPALDGLTPRESVAQPKYRARVDTLLKEMEYHESQETPSRRFDFSPLRRMLGLG